MHDRSLISRHPLISGRFRFSQGCVVSGFKTAIVAGLSVLLIGVAGTASAQDATPPTAQPPVAVAAPPLSPEAALLQRGQYLATAGDCIACHTRGDGDKFAGGLSFKTDFGTIYSANITSDPETGIGKWTEEQFARAMRQGIAADGSHLYPAFPYTAYTKVTDEDVHAIYAYLKSLPPVEYTPPKNEMPFPFNQRALMIVWNKLFMTEGAYTPKDGQSAEWNRGAYLVEGLGHCGTCHTPRNMLGGEKNSLALTGGIYQDTVVDAVHEQEIVKQDEGTVRQWSTSNLASSPRGLGAWSLEEIAAYLKTGHNARAGAFGPMSEVVSNSTQYMTDEDIHAMATYLKSLPAQAQEISGKPSAEQMKKGEIAFTVRCVTCHQPTGLGSPQGPQSDPTKVSPPLVGNTVVQAQDPSTLINVILYGAHEAILNEKAWPKMPGFELDFGLGMDDDQISLIAGYVRNSWGNEAGVVDPKQVSKQR